MNFKIFLKLFFSHSVNLIGRKINGKGVRRIEQIFLYGLLVIGLITVLYVIFADFADAFEGVFSPTTVLSFLLFICATGFILTNLTNWSDQLIIVVSLLVSTVFTFLLYYFVLIPLSSAEVSLAYSDADLQGQVGRVIVPIPSDGYGEIIIETVNGILSKRAAGYENEEIEYDKQVLIIEVKEGTFLVKEYLPL